MNEINVAPRKRAFRWMALAFAWIILMILLVLGVLTERADADPIPPTNGRTLPSCTSEDGSFGPVPCVWLAVDTDDMPAVGNGTGESFRIYRSGRVKVITDRRAYQLLHGMPNHDRVVVRPTTTGGGGGTHGCINEQRAIDVPIGASKQEAERYIRVDGLTVRNELSLKIRHYHFCGHKSGWLSTMYTRTKGHDWQLESAMLMYACKNQLMTGEWVACPFDTLDFWELALLKQGGFTSRRLV